MNFDRKKLGFKFGPQTLALGLGLFLSLSAFANGQNAGVGKAVSVSGKVLLRYEGGTTLQTGFLKPGDSIAKGAIINTGSTGTVKLLMTDRTIVDLGPSSLFKVNEYQLKNGSDRNVDLSLDYGTARSSVNQPITSDKGKFTIRTKAATMGVRGTEFIINAPLTQAVKKPTPVTDAGATVPQAPAAPEVSAQTQITVVKGKVEVQAQNVETGKTLKSFQVNSGMQFTSETKIDSPKVVQLPPQEIVKIRADAYQKDMTFLQAVSIDPVGNSNDKGPAQNQSNSPPSDKNAPKEGAKQTFESITKTIEVQSQQSPPPVMTDLKLPGMFNQNGQIQRAIEYQNGVPIRMTINITI